MDAARQQRVCAACGKAGEFQAHHVIERQYLRINGYDIWNALNALRVCPEPCHGQHSRGTKRLKLSMLTDENIDYAFMLLGDYAPIYLRQHYDGDDPRLERGHENGDGGCN